MTSLVSRVENLERRVNAQRELVSAAKGALRSYEESRGVEDARSVRLLADAETTLRARLLLEKYSEDEQAGLVGRVEALVSRGLQVIFGAGFEFKINVGTLRKQAAMEFRVVGPSGVELDPVSSHGGGLVNVVAMVLRLVVVALTPGMSRVVVLDEPFVQLSAGYREGIGVFLRDLVEHAGIQLIIVTHAPEIVDAADAAYEVSKDPERGTIVRRAR